MSNSIWDAALPEDAGGYKVAKPGKIQIRIRQEAVWIPTTILLRILNDLLTDTCLALKEESKAEKQHE